MTPQPTNPVEVFYSYAHEDEGLRDELNKHLANLKRQGVITGWYDRDVSAGTEWDSEIRRHRDSASVILLLISPDFMNSDYSNNVEVKRAMERHEAGEARVIPIVLRPVDWEGTPFSKLQGLPTDARAVTLWPNYDEAFLSVVKGIRRALQEPTIRSTDALLLTNIPRRPVVGFVARRDSDGRDIVGRLKDELDPQKNQLIALSGSGGVGKTTLASEATRAMSESFENRIVWTSALGRGDFTLSTLLDEIATQLGQASLRTLAPEPKAEQIQALVAAAATLIILDNFETIAPSEQEACIEFLLNRAACPALVTTRLKISKARNITIPVMSREEADDFLQRLIDQATDPSAFAQLDRDRIMQASERNPLVMQWVTGQIDLAQDAETVLDELAHGVGDAAQRVFDRSFGLEQLGDDGRSTLLALSLFALDASRQALAEVAGFYKDFKRLNDAVKRLASLWLVKTAASGSRLTVAGLTRELAKAQFLKDDRADDFRRRYVESFLKYASKHKEAKAEDYDVLEAEKENLVIAADIALGLEDWKSVGAIVNIIAVPDTGFLAVHGYWADAIRLIEQALKASHWAKSQIDIAGWMHNLATMREVRGEVNQARRLFDESLEISRKLGNQSLIARTLHELGRLAQAQGDLLEAQRLYDQSLEIARKLGDQVGISITLHQLAMLSQTQGNLPEARRLYDESLETERKLGNQNGIAISLHQLGGLALLRGDLPEARRLYNESLEINKRLGNQSIIASTLHELGRLARANGDRPQARRLSDESLEIARKLGHQSGIAITLGQLGLLAEDEGDRVEAARLYSEALAIFEKLRSPQAEIARESLERVEGRSS